MTTNEQRVPVPSNAPAQAGGPECGAPVLPPTNSTIKFVIPGRPAAWQRARSNGKVRFDSPEQVRNKLTIGQIGASAMAGRPPLEGPLEVEVRAFWQWPKSMSEKKRRTYGAHYFPARPDGDNLMKLLGDALNGIIWRDDAQIVRLMVSKSYGLTPQTVVLVTALTEEMRNGNAQEFENA